MREKSKVILGSRKRWYHFRESEKRMIIEEYLGSGLSKQAIWEKYTGQTEEHGHILRWMRQLGYQAREPHETTIFARTKKKIPMKKKTESVEESFEVLQLRRRVAELEKQASESEMKAVAFSTMVDIAEREFGISIRKKFNTKPSKR